MDNELEPSDSVPTGALDRPDERDYSAEHILGGEDIDIPENILLKLDEGNQGGSVMCTTFSAYHAAQIANEYEHKTQLTPNFIKGWSLQGEFGTRIPQGDYVQTALKSIVKNGFHTLSGKYEIKGYARIKKSEIDYWLARGYAIVTSALTTKTNFRKARETGIWGGNDGDKVGGHAFILAGRSPGFKIASNSYGEDWGKYNNGTFKIADKDVSELGSCYIIHDKEDLDYIYKDVTTASEHAEAIAWAKEEGLMNGYEDGRFGPNDPLTRAQFAEVMFRKSNQK